jgi:ABC-2 type transport system ATP-binding protein
VRFLIKAEKLKKSYTKKVFLNGISLHVERGRALAIVGKNGAGKTTLLKILATVSKADSGTLIIDGKDAKTNAKSVRELIGYIPQGVALMKELSVSDNLYYWMKKKDIKIHDQILKIIDLEDVHNKKVKALSGGMKRRLNIGASLVHSPSLLILDEPMVGIDLDNRRKLAESFGRIKEQGVTIIFSSHYVEEMYNVADALLALKNGECSYYEKIKRFEGNNLQRISEIISMYT